MDDAREPRHAGLPAAAQPVETVLEAAKGGNGKGKAKGKGKNNGNKGKGKGNAKSKVRKDPEQVFQKTVSPPYQSFPKRNEPG